MLLNIVLHPSLQFTGLLGWLPLIPFIPRHAEPHQHSQASDASISKR